MLHQPDLLFLDEPTAGLDPVNARRIKDLILDQKADGKTIFLTTHDMTVADELYDRLAFIVDGEISLIDSPSNLKLEYGKPEVKVEYGSGNQLDSGTFPIQGLADNKEFQQILSMNQIRTMHTQEATLESIFIQVTGRSLV
jgi:fluoroquinolone transport system ATP-binding protein